MAPIIEADVALLKTARERELRKTLARLRAPLLGRRREMPMNERPPVRKRLRVRSGFVDRLRVRAYPGQGT